MCFADWSPSRVPLRFGPRGCVLRFARDAGVHDTDVPRAVGVATGVLRRHVSAGALAEALAAGPPGLRQLVGPIDVAEPARKTR